MTNYLETKDNADVAVKQVSLDLQDPIGEAAGETMDESLPLQQAGSASYDVCSTGPLTYYRYYFEDASPSTYAVVKPKSAAGMTSLPTGLVGAGVLTATVISGLAIADVVKDRSAAVPRDNSTNAPVKQKQTQPRPNPTPTPPEMVEQAPLSNQANRPLYSKATSSPTGTPDRSAALESNGPLSSAELQNSIEPLVTLPSTSAPNLSIVKPSKPSQPAVPPKPKMAKPQPAAKTPVKAGSQKAATTSISSNPSASSQEAQAQTAEARVSAGLTMAGVAPPEVLAPQSSSRSADSPLSNTDSGVSGTVQSPAPTAKPETDEANAIDAASAGAALSSSQLLNDVQGIQDFVTLPKKAAPGSEIALMPLTQKAAQEAEVSKTVGEFKILKLPAQQYVGEWRTSNKSAVDADSVSGLPAYGFIDYQRQLIVVLNDMPAPTLSSR